jgi:hypothetical protein
MEFLMKAFYTFCHNYESKSYQINSIKSCSSRSFQQTTPKAHSNSSQIFSLQFILIFNDKTIQYSRTFVFCKSKKHKPMHQIPHRELSKDTKNTIWSSNRSHKLQNKLPSFIDRLQVVQKNCVLRFFPNYHFAHPRCV